ncbi:MAG: hormogonium polysaccharide biosynthesis glycosyltransferase HpsP [Geitlerinemataceae cyanobacterium]
MAVPLKVLQIVPSISLVYGGPSQMIRGFSKALARAGADVTILTTNSNGDNGQPPLDVPLDRAVEQDGYQVRHFPCALFQRYKFSPALLLWLWRNAFKFEITHIHALFSPVSSLSAWICRLRRLPYILRPLGTLDPADLRKKRWLKQIYVALLEGPNLKQAAAIHFTATDEAKISERFGASTPHFVLPLGVELPAPVTDRSCLDDLAIDPARPLLLYMSRIEPKKGLDLLIPALEKVAASGLDFQFVLAGANPQDPDYEQGILKQIQDSTIAARTIATGFVTGDVKAALLDRADLFVLPSYYENFGIAVAEAMVAGAPVLISNRVQIWDTIRETDSGWVVPCKMEAIAAALTEALSLPDRREQCGTNARNCALERYSWDAIAERALELYRQYGRLF